MQQTCVSSTKSKHGAGKVGMKELFIVAVAVGGGLLNDVTLGRLTTSQGRSHTQE